MRASFLRRAVTIVPVLMALVLLAACVGGSLSTEIAPRAGARALAADAGFSERLVETKVFDLTVFARGLETGFDPGQPVHVYIEGDGRAWFGRRYAPRDPTPRNPVALRLAAADPAATVLYLARPCQYVEGPRRRHCHSRVWTRERFAPAVVDALDDALERLLTGRRRPLLLIGYSGGGLLAAALAARRPETVGLITVAAPLDLAAWTRRHGVTPLTAPHVGPGRRRARASLPQWHFVGGRDAVVPPDLARRYAGREANPDRIRIIRVPAMTHEGPWWPGWAKRLQQLDRPVR